MVINAGWSEQILMNEDLTDILRTTHSPQYFTRSNLLLFLLLNDELCSTLLYDNTCKYVEVRIVYTCFIDE